MLKSQAQSSSTLKDMLSSNELPFAVMRYPGESRVRMAMMPEFDGSSLRFAGLEVNTWLDAKYESMPVAKVSTQRADYECAVDAVIDLLRIRGGKTVICRQICGKFSRSNPFEMAEEYFALFPDMFCFLFYHPAVGYWMGASPELLLEIDADGVGHTRALAGTRRRDAEEQWSVKNKQEHSIVVDDICSRVTTACGDCTAIVRPTDVLKYGNIEHLLTPIDIFASSKPLDMHRLVGAIHPTAAVCGYPMEQALPEIASAEAAPRYFYGGTFVAPNLAYVVLRCVHFDEHNWCIFTGSGITPHSMASEEWDETEDKAAPLLNILKKY